MNLAVCRAVAAGMAAGVLASGCGAALTPSRVAGSTGAVGPAVHRQQPWPPGGSRSLARSVGRRLLASLVLPAGTRHLAPRRTPRVPEIVGARTVVDLHAFYSVPLPPLAAANFFSAHPPPGLRAEGTGTTGGSGASYDEFVQFSPRKPPAGISSDTVLLVTLASGRHGRTIARADAQVVWYPPRTPAEYLRPGAFRSVRISASFYNTRPRHVARVITSRRAIARLAALLNGMHAADGGVRFCPMIDAAYHIVFVGRAGQPRVLVDATGCATDNVAVSGKAQPALWDPDERIIHAIHKLLGLSQRFR